MKTFHHLVLGFFLFTIFSPAGWGRFEQTLLTTAQSLILATEPTADFDAPETKKALTRLEAELKFVFEHALTEKGQEAFFQPLPYVPGQLSFSVDEPTSQHLHALVGKNRTLDLTQKKTGIAPLDALNAKYQATALEEHGSFWVLELSKNVNPNRIAPEFEKLPFIKWAEPNRVVRFGGLQPVLRMSGRPAVYRFTIGWGDCPSGCIYNHRRYFEVWDTRKVAKLGESGDPLDQNDEDPDAVHYFK